MNKDSWNGVQHLLDDYCGVTSNDAVVVCFTSETHEFAAWIKVALDIRHVPVAIVGMVPLVDAEFPERFEDALPSPETLRGRLFVVTLERDTLSHERQIRNALRKYKPESTRVYRAISACEKLFSMALAASPAELSRRNTTLLDRFLDAKNLRITTPSGSDLNVTLDSGKHRWVSNRGTWRQGSFVLLPAGEVATFPSGIDGVFVADFAFNINMLTNRDARLENHPVTVWLNNGKAIKLGCADSATLRFVSECLESQCSNNVGELGFGTNFAISEAIPLNSHINERRPGIHLGLGQSNQSPDVVGYDCDIHLDLIANRGLVWVDDDPIPIDMAALESSTHAHPDHTASEDAHSARLDDLDVDDCCGVLAADGIRLFTRPSS